MSGVRAKPQCLLEFAREADRAIIGSGVRTREVAADGALLSRIPFDPDRADHAHEVN